jgi:uncharacterized protein
MGTPPERIDDALVKLEAWMQAHAPVVVCLSGGVDSSVLAAVGRRALNRECIAVTGISPSLKAADRKLAASLCQSIQLAHLEIDVHEMKREEYRSNPVNRCFFCKDELFVTLRKHLPARFEAATLIEGTHPEDLNGHRPGHQAALKSGVLSPFIALNWNKDLIRAAALHIGLPVDLAAKPSSPCLSSRIPFGTRITADKLQCIEQAEKTLSTFGFTRCRVRHHGTIARIEIPTEDFSRFLEDAAGPVAERLRALGFTYTTLDVLGLRSGSMLDAVESAR